MIQQLLDLSARIMLIFIDIDHALCKFYMRLTGLGRKSYVCIIYCVLLVGILARTAIARDSIIYLILIIPLISWFLVMYLNWLKNPAEGLSTVKLDGHEIYYELRAVTFFCIVTLYKLFIFIILLGLWFSDWNYALYFYGLELLLQFFYAVRTNSGPPKPNNTFWQQAKSKVKSIIEANRRPVLIPIPLGA